jgi:tetratricopeptide (TPR) repeat protein
MRYREALRAARAAQVDPAIVYAEIVTPLVDLLRNEQDEAKLEEFLAERVKSATPGLELGLALADLGLHYQNGETSADRFRGEELIDRAIATFEACSSDRERYTEQCRRRLADTAGLQGAIYFQQGKYSAAEPLFRRVVAMPEQQVQTEVLIVSMNALRGILVLRKDFDEARKIELRVAALEAVNPAAVARLRRGER